MKEENAVLEYNNKTKFGCFGLVALLIICITIQSIVELCLQYQLN
jgi:hypothetical protein